MLTTTSLNQSQTVRVRLAALWMALMALGYGALSVLYFYLDFFAFWHEGSAMMLESAGLAVHIEGSLWTVLSFTRPLMAAASVVMLAISANALWRGRPRARVLSVVTLWGLVLPQTLWYTEFLADWHQGQGIGVALAAALVAVSVPTALMAGRRVMRQFEGRDTLSGWATLTYGRGRLLASAVTLGWLGFAATEFMDHAYRLPSDLAYFGALMAFALSAAAVAGIVNLRAWALWAGVAATLFMGLIPLAGLWTPYMPNIGWHINTAVAMLANHDLQCVGLALIPLSVLWLLAGPFLNSFIRKLMAR